MITSKTSCEHATADVDDERGRKFIGQEAGMNGPSNLHSCTADTCLCSITGMSNTLSLNGIRGMSNSKNCWNLSLHGHRNVSRPPSIRTPPWTGGTAPHPRGRGGRSNVETRVSLCQYQIPPSSSLSPYHTTSTPAGACQTVLLVRLFQK